MGLSALSSSCRPVTSAIVAVVVAVVAIVVIVVFIAPTLRPRCRHRDYHCTVLVIPSLYRKLETDGEKAVPTTLKSLITAIPIIAGLTRG